MDLQEAIDANGIFWLPENLDDQVPGHLHISQSGHITLNIFGIPSKLPTTQPTSLSAFLHLAHPNTDVAPRVVGITDKGLFTLEKCLRGSGRTNLSGGISHSKLRPQIALGGVVLDASEEMTFSSLGVEFGDLHEWLSRSGFEVEYPNDLQNPSYTYRFSPPPSITVRLPHDRTLRIAYSWTAPTPDSTTNTLTVQHHAYAALDSGVSQSFFSLFRDVAVFRNLLALAAGQQQAIRSIVGRSPAHVRQSSTQPIPIQVYLADSESRKTQASVSCHEMLFTYRDVESNFEEVIRTWFSSYDSTAAALDLYFSVASGAFRHVEGRFLSLAQALESFHRHRLEQSDRGTVHHKTTLRERLTELVNEFPNHFGDDPTRDDFVGDVVHARNQLTHHAATDMDGDSNTATLLKMELRLQALFELHLLKTIGIEPSTIEEVARSQLAHKLEPEVL